MRKKSTNPTPPRERTKKAKKSHSRLITHVKTSFVDIRGI